MTPMMWLGMLMVLLVIMSRFSVPYVTCHLGRRPKAKKHPAGT